MDRISLTRVAAALVAIALLIACGAGDDPPAQEADVGEELATAAQEPATAEEPPPTGWRVDLDVDHPQDTMGNAFSPVASVPEALAGAEDDFGSYIRYLCLNASEREQGNVAPVMILFQTAPRLVMVEGGQAGEYGQIPVELRTSWGGEEVAFTASFFRRVTLEQEDAAERETGESSNDEFLRRLLESGSTADDAVEIEFDWQEVGPVRYSFSLEGAADAIREAGRPCGIM
ncbi:MAG: hypothetical protein OXF01_06235 [Gemmatimonadetes bacterium]|nr:hypothetical protein [Gemmatimonadota bacterium]